MPRGISGPLLQHFTARLSSRVQSSERLGVALSGGADSLGVALLAAWWSGSSGKVPAPPTPPECTPGATSKPLSSLTEVVQQYKQPYQSAPQASNQPSSLWTAAGFQDSSSLLCSTARATEHRAAQSSCTPVAFIVDHALRENSAADAEEAARLATHIGFEPVQLRLDWQGAAPRHGHKMRAARDARYKALVTACQENGIKVLLTGHHADDAAETFLLRLSRGSGLDGLACMAEASLHSGSRAQPVQLLRPLLGVHKADLVQLCRENGLPWIEDPTNADTSFSRNMVRRLLHRVDPMQHSYPASSTADNAGAAAATAGRDSRWQGVVADILQVQAACTAGRARLHHQAATLLRQCVPVAGPAAVQPEGGVRVLLPPLLAAAPPVAQRAVAALLQHASGAQYPPSLKATDRLCCTLQSQSFKEHNQEYQGGGCSVRLVAGSKGAIAVLRPLPRMKQKHL